MEIPSQKSSKAPVPSLAMRCELDKSGDVALRRLARWTWTVACIWGLTAIRDAYICGTEERILVLL